jgi:zinc transport system ATP-binding protein
MKDAVVELDDVWVTLGREQVLQGIELRVARGEFVAVIGPNGGGKTTLLRVLLGLVRPERGTVRVLGAAPETVRGRVAYVPQVARFDLDFPIRVIDMVSAGRLRRRALLRPLAPDDRRRALARLRQLEIDDLAERPVGSLSGGQLQRALIARALTVDPELLVLDEPTASLDVQSADDFYGLLEGLLDDMTVVLSSHDVTGVSSRVGSIACLNRRLYFHPTSELTPDVLAEVYGCPVELLAHGVPHRVLREHGGEGGR